MILERKLQENFAEGKAEGRAEGHFNALAESCRRMLDNNVPVSQIKNYLGLDDKTIEKIRSGNTE